MRENPARDRISSLQDKIIGHILSYLDTRSAIRTSVLSKRWRYLWTNVVDLDFFYHPAHYSEKYYDFVDKVLQQCTTEQVHRCRFFLFKANFNRVKAWVNEVIRRNVSEIELRLDSIPTPSRIFTCKTLTVFRLFPSVWPDFEFPDSFYLPSLRILEIGGVFFYNNLMEKVIQSCPVLEDLTVNMNSKFPNLDCDFIISSSVLKRLSFSSNRKTLYGKFVISAPNLEYMNICGVDLPDYVVLNLPSIAEACVEDFESYRDEDFILDGETMDRTVKLLRGLIDVKSLTPIGAYSLTALDHAHLHQLPVYHNITRLDLTLAVGDGWKIPRLLQLCPKLNVLILNMVPSLNKGGAHDWYEPESLPECLSSSLEFVEIRVAIREKYELKLVKYLLMHSQCLKKFDVNVKGLPYRYKEENTIFLE